MIVAILHALILKKEMERDRDNKKAKLESIIVIFHSKLNIYFSKLRGEFNRGPKSSYDKLPNIKSYRKNFDQKGSNIDSRREEKLSYKTTSE